MVKEIRVKSVLNRLKVQDNWFLVDYSLNPFTGCALNCIYCYIHGSKYGGEDTTALQVKVNAPEVLYRQLKNRTRKRQYGFVGVGSSTDPYPPIEEDLEITRELLKIIYRFKFPANITTKSTMILRDLELLRKIGEKAILPPNLENKLEQGVIVSFSFSTVDPYLAGLFEPGASTVEGRLETMQKFKDEGFLVGANLMPILPFLSDSEEQLDEMIKQMKDHGADFVLVAGLTLFGDKKTDCKIRYYDTLKKYFPSILPKTQKLFGSHFAPSSAYQHKLARLSEKLALKHGIRTRILEK
ncbi:MAG TPA: radical SAM protein [Methanobacterium sp.]|nr:radical SAM protein [Methanobacterium sp.]